MIQTATGYVSQQPGANDSLYDLYQSQNESIGNDVSEMYDASSATAQATSQTEATHYRAQRMQRRATNNSSPGFFHRMWNNYESQAVFGGGAFEGAAEMVYSATDTFDHPVHAGFAIFAAGLHDTDASLHFVHELLHPSSWSEAGAQLKDDAIDFSSSLEQDWQRITGSNYGSDGLFFGRHAAALGLFEFGGEAADAAGMFSEDYGVAFFGKDNLKYYVPNAFDSIPNLGARGRSFFMMPISDAGKINSSVRAAIETGFSPSTLKAWTENGDIYGISFPTKGMDVRLPKEADAMGWRHFLDGGHTAINAEGTNSFIVNTTREFVTPGGSPMPKGSVLFRLDEDNGSWSSIWRY